MKKIDILNILVKCQKEFDSNLKNKQLIFISENKSKDLEIDEVFFPKSCFYYLTGIVAYDQYGQELNSYKFYELLSKGRLDDEKLKRKDNTTDLKLQVLQQLMKIDRTANIIGEFIGDNIYLQTQKIAGTVNACMGFVKSNDKDKYVPNTVLKKDIREIARNRKRIIAILKKDVNEEFYKNITYLKQNYEIDKVLSNKEISKKIDILNAYSLDKIINEKVKGLKNRL